MSHMDGSSVVVRRVLRHWIVEADLPLFDETQQENGPDRLAERRDVVRRVRRGGNLMLDVRESVAATPDHDIVIGDGGREPGDAEARPERVERAIKCGDALRVRPLRREGAQWQECQACRDEYDHVSAPYDGTGHRVSPVEHRQLDTRGA